MKFYLQMQCFLSKIMEKAKLILSKIKEVDFVKILLQYLKKKGWYLFLLVASSVYVWYYRYQIHQLSELNAQNLIFILWLLLLFWPLFSEMEFLGVKIKKEVQKATEEVKQTTKEVKQSTEDVKSSVKTLEFRISQLQLTNSVANHISFSNAPLPSEGKMDQLLKKVNALQNNYHNYDTDNRPFFAEDSFPDIDRQSIYLFKVRLSIETALKELCERYDISDRLPMYKMIQLLLENEIIDHTTFDLINQVIKIANRGVHGELVSSKYVDFVKDTYPEICARLKKHSKNK